MRGKMIAEPKFVIWLISMRVIGNRPFASATSSWVVTIEKWLIYVKEPKKPNRLLPILWPSIKLLLGSIQWLIRLCGHEMQLLTNLLWGIFNTFCAMSETVWLGIGTSCVLHSQSSILIRIKLLKGVPLGFLPQPVVLSMVPLVWQNGLLVVFPYLCPALVFLRLSSLHLFLVLLQSRFLLGCHFGWVEKMSAYPSIGPWKLLTPTLAFFSFEAGEAALALLSAASPASFVVTKWVREPVVLSMLPHTQWRYASEDGTIELSVQFASSSPA